jgi:membrane associated rhomboid family serine protease
MEVTEGGRRSPALVRFIVALNVGVFLLWVLPGVPLQVMADHFLVSWNHLLAGRPWVLVGSVFSHHLLFHLLLNMIVLLSFGPPLERIMGKGEFLVFYLLAGAVGSLAHAGVSAFLLGAPELPALGASSAIAGILLLFALVFPRAKVLLFFILPLPAIVAAFAFIALDVWGLFAQMEGGGLPIGHGAHLGGAFTGVLWFLLRGRALRRRRGWLA